MAVKFDRPTLIILVLLVLVMAVLLINTAADRRTVAEMAEFLHKKHANFHQRLSTLEAAKHAPQQTVSQSAAQQ